MTSLLVQGLTGFLVSLVMLEMLRFMLKGRWPQQVEGLQLELRPMPWLLALVAGPALFWDATVAYRRRETGTAVDLLAIVLVLAVWSTSYGMACKLVMTI